MSLQKFQLDQAHRVFCGAAHRLAVAVFDLVAEALKVDRLMDLAQIVIGWNQLVKDQLIDLGWFCIILYRTLLLY